MIRDLENGNKKIETDGDQVRFIQNVIEAVLEGYTEVVEVAFFSFQKEVTLSKPTEDKLSEALGIIKTLEFTIQEPAPIREIEITGIIDTATEDLNKEAEVIEELLETNYDEEEIPQVDEFNLDTALALEVGKDIIEYAKVYGYKLDGRKSVDKMKEQLVELIAEEESEEGS